MRAGAADADPGDTVAAMAKALRALSSGLPPDRRAGLHFPFAGDERFEWFFVPRPRHGVPLGDLDAAGLERVHTLLHAGLGDSGYSKVTGIIGLEPVLKELEGGSERRDPRRYYVRIFGEPGGREPWGWSFEGHHVSLNYTLVGGRLAATPSFLGANPAEVRHGEKKGLRVLGREEDLARALVASLDSEQRAAAVVSELAPSDIISFNSRRASPLAPGEAPLARTGREALRNRRPAHRRGPGAYDGIDAFDLPVPHPEHVEVGEAAGEVDERHHEPCLDVDEEPSRAVVGDHEALRRTVVSPHQRRLAVLARQRGSPRRREHAVLPAIAGAGERRANLRRRGEHAEVVVRGGDHRQARAPLLGGRRLSQSWSFVARTPSASNANSLSRAMIDSISEILPPSTRSRTPKRIGRTAPSAGSGFLPEKAFAGPSVAEVKGSSRTALACVPHWRVSMRTRLRSAFPAVRQSPLPTATSTPFSVDLTSGARGSPEGSWAASAAKYWSTRPLRASREQSDGEA